MFKNLAEARDTQMGTITYNFADGTKQVCPINQAVFFDERGRKKQLNQVMEVFNSTAWDLGAISFEI